jgi:hypothetical protein
MYILEKGATSFCSFVLVLFRAEYSNGDESTNCFLVIYE